MGVRALRSHHLAALAAIRCATRPEAPCDAADLGNELPRDGVSLVDVRADAPVGFGYRGWKRGLPGVQVIDVHVAPELQGRGIGRGLERELGAAAPPGARELRAGARADHPYALEVLLRRGFTEHMRHVFSERDLGEELPPLSAPAGVTLRTYTELIDERGAAVLHAGLRGLLADTMGRIPGLEGYEVSEGELEHNLGSPTRLAASHLVALAGEEVIGETWLCARPGASDLTTAYTGVAAPWLRRGVARALKLRSLHWARAHGARRVYTANAADNTAIRGLNRSLGFEPTCEYVELARRQTATGTGS